jgi:hypothetical protein
MGSWSADSSNHSEHYDHSTNNDDVITGLLGIVPRSDKNFQLFPITPKNWSYFAIENLAYHGHLVTVLYDADGTRYNNGSGLSIFVDGPKVYNGEGTSALVPLPNAPVVLPVIPVNIAANPNGLGSYPLASATYTYFADDPYKAIDGYLFYDSIPDNRWTNYQSSTPNDTLTVTFARSRNVSSVTLALFSDVDCNGKVDVPSSIEIYGSSGFLTTITSGFLPNDRNTFPFGQVETDFIAVNLFNRQDVSVGVCELEVWAPSVSSPVYYSVDALLTGASVINDGTSTATSNGAVVGNLVEGNVVAFSGIESGGGNAEVLLSYANAGTISVTVEILVNQVPKGGISLDPSGGKYVSASLTAEMGIGKNFVSLVGGSSDIRYEILSI